MAPLKVHGPVRMRSMQTGITKWKEGSFEIVEKDNKVSLVVHYNVGGIPKTFQVARPLGVARGPRGVTPTPVNCSGLLLKGLLGSAVGMMVNGKSQKAEEKLPTPCPVCKILVFLE